MGKKLFKQEDIDSIVTRYVYNMESIKEISLTYNCDSSVINRILRENDVKIVKGSAFSVEYWVKRGMDIKDAELKTKQIKPSLIEYWLNKGYNQEQSKLQVELHLMNTERAFIIKYGELEGKKFYKEKKDNEGKYNSPRKKEYWIKKGYSEEESKKLIKQKQSTFSLDKCIEKYGDEEGIKMFKIRQEKWISTLKNKKNYNEIQKLKNSTSLEAIMSKYPDNYVEKYFKINLNNEKYMFFIDEVKNCDYNGFLEKIKTHVEYDSKYINAISKIKLFHHVFNRDDLEMKLDLNKLYNVRNKQSFGTTFSVYGYIVRSLGEKLILENLMKLNIDFIYDKFYPNQKKFKYDFYLPKYDLYIEYFGMSNVKMTDKNKKIIEKYNKKSEQKLELCLKNNYNFLFSSEIDEVLTYINNLK